MQAGYFTLDSSASERFKPPKELEDFLAEHHPIYIGFGSLVVDDPEVRITQFGACPAFGHLIPHLAMPF